MTAVFARWAHQLVREAPYMYNCAWNKDGKKFLGGSLASGRLNSFNTDIAGTWGRVVKRARYRLMNREILGLAGWSFEYHPQLVHGRKTPIGNCAECYICFRKFLTL